MNDLNELLGEEMIYENFNKIEKIGKINKIDKQKLINIIENRIENIKYNITCIIDNINKYNDNIVKYNNIIQNNLNKNVENLKKYNEIKKNKESLQRPIISLLYNNEIIDLNETMDIINMCSLFNTHKNIQYEYLVRDYEINIEIKNKKITNLKLKIKEFENFLKNL